MSEALLALLCARDRSGEEEWAAAAEGSALCQLAAAAAGLAPLQSLYHGAGGGGGGSGSALDTQRTLASGKSSHRGFTLPAAAVAAAAVAAAAAAAAAAASAAAAALEAETETETELAPAPAAAPAPWQALDDGSE